MDGSARSSIRSDVSLPRVGSSSRREYGEEAASRRRRRVKKNRTARQTEILRAAETRPRRINCWPSRSKLGSRSRKARRPPPIPFRLGRARGRSVNEALAAAARNRRGAVGPGHSAPRIRGRDKSKKPRACEWRGRKRGRKKGNAGPINLERSSRVGQAAGACERLRLRGGGGGDGGGTYAENRREKLAGETGLGGRR